MLRILPLIINLTLGGTCKRPLVCFSVSNYLCRRLECLTRSRFRYDSACLARNFRSQIVSLIYLIARHSAYQATKFLLRKLLDSNNVLAPLRFLLKLLLGSDFSSQSQKSHDYLDTIWAKTRPDEPDKHPLLPKKILGLPIALFKSLVLAVIGLCIQLTIFLLQRGKNRKLKELEAKEEEERLRMLEEEWAKHLKEQEPELVLLKEVTSDEDGLSMHAYEGEMNGMTFNHIKNSRVFNQGVMLDVQPDEEDFSWLNSTQTTASTNSSLFENSDVLKKKSEDGWNKKKKLLK